MDEGWERSPAEVAETFARPGRLEGIVTIGVAAVVEGATTADVRVDRLADDSIRTLRFELALEQRDDGTWRVESAEWSQASAASSGAGTRRSRASPACSSYGAAAAAGRSSRNAPGSTRRRSGEGR